MKNIFKSLLYILSLSIVVSCHDDLNQSPIDPDRKLKCLAVCGDRYDKKYG